LFGKTALTISELITPDARRRVGIFMFSYLVIAIGGALGSVARFWLSGAVAQSFGETFPAGTLLVNISGSLVIGFFAGLTGPDGRFLVNPTIRQFFMMGICGGYTTFSSFSLQTLTLARDGEFLFAVLNIASSVILCLLAVWLGDYLAMHLNQR
jgi:fluoride exporter